MKVLHVLLTLKYNTIGSICLAKIQNIHIVDARYCSISHAVFSLRPKRWRKYLGACSSCNCRRGPTVICVVRHMYWRVPSLVRRGHSPKYFVISLGVQRKPAMWIEMFPPPPWFQCYWDVARLFFYNAPRFMYRIEWTSGLGDYSSSCTWLSFFFPRTGGKKKVSLVEEDE